MNQVLPDSETVDRVKLDGVECLTEASTIKIHNDNSWIEMLYQENVILVRFSGEFREFTTIPSRLS